MAKLTVIQKQDFIEAYVENELDTLFNGMSKKDRIKILKTDNKEKITKELIKGVQRFNTVEDVRNGFDDVYDEVLGIS